MSEACLQWALDTPRNAYLCGHDARTYNGSGFFADSSLCSPACHALVERSLADVCTASDLARAPVGLADTYDTAVEVYRSVCRSDCLPMPWEELLPLITQCYGELNKPTGSGTK